MSAEYSENPALQAAAEDVAAALEAAENKRSQEAFCLAIRTDPHEECVLPYFLEILYTQVSLDPSLMTLAEEGRFLLGTKD